MTKNNHFDVLIVGAGISGIGMGCHLEMQCPGKTYAILEGRKKIGGTWDLFRYPGIRSDSDMYTLGYGFRPWMGLKALADGPSIRAYVEETAAAYGVDKHIHFQHQVKKARWSDEAACWQVEAIDGKGKKRIFTCNFLQLAAGYYSYKGGYRPDFPHEEAFSGEILHPQQWPDDYDVKGKRFIVIGSGATAVTLVPALAQAGAAHVAMLQRSPTYVVSLPAIDPVARWMHKLLPTKWAQTLNRRRLIFLQDWFFKRSRNKPEKVRNFIYRRAQKALPQGYDVQRHFQPRYNPWDQRMCLIPDSDMFNAIREGKASVVTDHIDRFTKEGILLKSGEEMKADVIITATGLQLVTLGEMEMEVNGAPVNISKSWVYKGLMYSGVPNLASIFGYINASWTLRADIQAEYVCRLLNEMDKKGMRKAVPALRAQDAEMTPRPFVEGFSSGYFQRVMDQLPQQSSEMPWMNLQDYRKERAILAKAPIDDGVLQFSDPALPGAGHNRAGAETGAAIAAAE